jgi:hypothetical protein
MFRDYYRCAACGCEWTFVWPSRCEDECPWCEACCLPPYKSEHTESDDE